MQIPTAGAVPSAKAPSMASLLDEPSPPPVPERPAVLPKPMVPIRAAPAVPPKPALQPVAAASLVPVGPMPQEAKLLPPRQLSQTDLGKI